MPHTVAVKISETHTNSWQFLVTIRDKKSASEHRVALNREYWDMLTDGLLFNEKGGRHLIQKSFEFLLSREPKESILSTFNLREITNYFPSYEDEIKREWKLSQKNDT